ncbi:MAG: hypothetical protein ACOX37_12035 [Bacillota bacterium]|jgi:predicted CXXCH cytochrome family protein
MRKVKWSTPGSLGKTIGRKMLIATAILFAFQIFPGHASSEAQQFSQQIESNSQFQQTMGENCLGCHQSVYDKFEASVHGKLGNILSCTTCHQNQHLAEADFLLDKSGISSICSSCHRGLVLESYERSFHGIAARFGYEKAPTCTDCHGSHRILPSDHPESPISAANIGSTCEPCHQGMTRAGHNLLNGKQHTVPEDKETGYPLWITWKIFLALILFDIVMNGTIPTLELFRHLRNLRTTGVREKIMITKDDTSEPLGEG